MATKGERQALLFLAAVALLGAATRVYHARQVAAPTGDLDRQIDAVQTVARRGHAIPSSGRKRGKRATPDSATDSSIAPPAEQPSRVDPPGRVDLDVASSAQIDRLPGIGPSLAKRIVAERDKNGMFGCLAALDSVRGVGPSMLRRLDSLVTFSGAPRPACNQR
jgi:competence protein ComEA